MNYIKTSLLVLGSVLLCQGASAAEVGRDIIACPTPAEFAWTGQGGFYGPQIWQGTTDQWSTIIVNQNDRPQVTHIHTDDAQLNGYKSWRLTCHYKIDNSRQLVIVKSDRVINGWSHCGTTGNNAFICSNHQ